MRDLRNPMQSVMPITFKTGGLGHLLVQDVYEAWVCVAHHACSDPVNEVRLPFCTFPSVFLLSHLEWNSETSVC